MHAGALRAFALVLALACLVVAGSPPLSRVFLFRASATCGRDVPPGLVVHELRAADGVPVHALELASKGDARVVVYFHNNRESALDCVALARTIAELGCGVVLVEYRGYGLSRGATATEAGLYADAEAVLRMLRSRGVRDERVTLWGTSLGSGVAAEMSRRGYGGELVLMSPYTSIADLVTNAVPGAPARALLEDRFDTLSKASQIHVPTLVIHGDEDEIVPFWMGQELSRGIRGARLLRVKGGHHGDLLLRERKAILEEVKGLGT